MAVPDQPVRGSLLGHPPPGRPRADPGLPDRAGPAGPIAGSASSLTTARPGPSRPATWPGFAEGVLPDRAGPRPEVTTTTPQEQLTQRSPVELQERLFARLADLPGVRTGASRISVPGARAFCLDDADGPADAFLVPEVGEFVHLHPAHDGSLHLALPTELAADS